MADCIRHIAFTFISIVFSILAMCVSDVPATHASSFNTDSYLINPGDVLSVFVWEEEQISQPEVLVRPDGYISIPMLGEVSAGGLSVSELQATITKGLAKFLRVSPSVTVSVKALTGNAVFVLGKVNRPGQYVLRNSTDVSQALALAGGVTTFASEGSIKILRRDSTGQQHALKFDYDDIKDGDNLESNIILHSGDVVIVP